jgi:hypothetical protein
MDALARGRDDRQAVGETPCVEVFEGVCCSGARVVG